MHFFTESRIAAEKLTLIIYGLQDTSNLQSIAALDLFSIGFKWL